MTLTNHITIDIPPMPQTKAEEAPHEITLAALNEARSGKYAGVIDTSSEDAFMKSLGL